MSGGRRQAGKARRDTVTDTSPKVALRATDGRTDAAGGTLQDTGQWRRACLWCATLGAGVDRRESISQLFER